MFSRYASRKSRSEITVWMPWPLNRDLGGGGGGGGGRGAKWPSNHFRLYTACCMCTEALEMQAPCMFDWQGTQTFLSCWNAKSQIRSLVCTLHNSNIAITSLVCALRNSNDNSNYALCSHVKIVKEVFVKMFYWYSTHASLSVYQVSCTMYIHVYICRWEFL